MDFTAYRDAVPAQTWYVPFLEHFAREGGPHLAAQAASIKHAWVERARDTDVVFAAEYEAALEFYRDMLEWMSVQLAVVRGNPLPFFARLKAERPDRYVEKQITAMFSVNVDTQLEGHDAASFLAGLLSAATPATRAELARGDIIDALPSATAPDDAQPGSTAEPRP
jgi:hypothetical protein